MDRILLALPRAEENKAKAIVGAQNTIAKATGALKVCLIPGAHGSWAIAPVASALPNRAFTNLRAAIIRLTDEYDRSHFQPDADPYENDSVHGRSANR